MKTAFISVSNKEGLVRLADALSQHQIDLMASKGTADFLKSHGFSVLAIEDYIQHGPLLDGRVKTLHPLLFSGILADRSNPQHLAELKQSTARLIDFIIVNLYPFSAKQDIDRIDIGGVSLLRAAAKNYQYCTVIGNIADYSELIKELNQQNGSTGLSFRKRMAAKAFAQCAHYDSAIANWCEAKAVKQMALQKTIPLSYGENPHQQAGFYNLIDEEPTVEFLQGKPLSYNNVLDFDAGMQLINEFEQPACAIVKHTNPCGVALAASSMQALELAFQADEKSAFGGIVIFNQEVSKEAAAYLSCHFFELIAAPQFNADAVEILAKKSRLRLICYKKQSRHIEIRSAINGFLLQEIDREPFALDKCIIPTIMQPRLACYDDLRFAFNVVRHMKSNAIVIAKNGRTLGMGMGQTNRVDAVAQALSKAEKHDLHHAVLASDGFFPFADSIECIAKSAIKTIIQPGGSRQDKAVIAACNEAGISMVMTGVRSFKH